MSRSVQAETVRPVSVSRLMELLGSLAQLQREGHTQWRLDVVWSGVAAPWYVEMCRRRAADLDLADRVVFRPAAGVPAGTHADATPVLATGGQQNRLVVMLEPMADRRSDDAPAPSDWALTAMPHRPAPAPMPSVDVAAGLLTGPDDGLRTRRRVAAAYEAVTESADPYRRRLVDAVA